MAPKPLIARFKETIKTRKKEFSAKLAKAETISSSDEHNKANTVEEEHVLDTLESASDYKQGLGCLDKDGKAIMKKLREWAGDLAKVAGHEWKRMTFFLPTCVKVLHARKSQKHLRRNQISQPLAQRISLSEILDWHQENSQIQHFDPIYPNLKIKQPLLSVRIPMFLRFFKSILSIPL